MMDTVQVLSDKSKPSAESVSLKNKHSKALLF